MCDDESIDVESTSGSSRQAFVKSNALLSTRAIDVFCYTAAEEVLEPLMSSAILL